MTAPRGPGEGADVRRRVGKVRVDHDSPPRAVEDSGRARARPVGAGAEGSTPVAALGTPFPAWQSHSPSGDIDERRHRDR